jgi:hypothetical protein
MSGEMLAPDHLAIEHGRRNAEHTIRLRVALPRYSGTFRT